MRTVSTLLSVESKVFVIAKTGYVKQIILRYLKIVTIEEYYEKKESNNIKTEEKAETSDSIRGVTDISGDKSDVTANKRKKK